MVCFRLQIRPLTGTYVRMLSLAATRGHLLGCRLLLHLMRDVEPLARLWTSGTTASAPLAAASGSVLPAFAGAAATRSTLESNLAWAYVVRSSDQPNSKNGRSPWPPTATSHSLAGRTSHSWPAVGGSRMP